MITDPLGMAPYRDSQCSRSATLTTVSGSSLLGVEKHQQSYETMSDMIQKVEQCQASSCPAVL